MRKNILFIHQSADLYGSDRVLLSLVAGLDTSKYFPIVLLPDPGPLLLELEHLGVEVHVVRLAKLSRSTVSVVGLFSLLFSLKDTVSSISHVLRGRKVSLVHSNTLATLSGAIWSYLKGVPHLWHVHEIILKPKIAVLGYSLLLKYFADKIICNSFATQANIIKRAKYLEKKTTVIYNGLEQNLRLSSIESGKLRELLCTSDRDIVVTLVGRINRMKGQHSLVSAATTLHEKGYRNIRYLIIGSPPHGQDHFLLSLKCAIEKSPAKEFITLKDFIADSQLIWLSSDIAVVPSTEPESFGMVALEAMAASKPVVVAAHGGLVEIVRDGKTGLYVDPNSYEDLASKIQTLVDDEKLRIKLGSNGKTRYLNHFTLGKYVTNMEKAYESM
jgi:glycosyltransferase involved in cell wall biosynthesis